MSLTLPFGLNDGFLEFLSETIVLVGIPRDARSRVCAALGLPGIFPVGLADLPFFLSM